MNYAPFVHAWIVVQCDLRPTLKNNHRQMRPPRPILCTTCNLNASCRSDYRFRFWYRGPLLQRRSAGLDVPRPQWGVFTRLQGRGKTRSSDGRENIFSSSSTDPFPSGFERTSGPEHTRGDALVCQPGIGCRGLVQESTSCCDLERTRGGDEQAEDESVKLRTYRFASVSSKAFPHPIELGRRVIRGMRQSNPNDVRKPIRENT